MLKTLALAAILTASTVTVTLPPKDTPEITSDFQPKVVEKVTFRRVYKPIRGRVELPPQPVKRK